MALYRSLDTFRGAGNAAPAEAAGMRTAILSNGSPRCSMRWSRAPGSTVSLDAVLSVEEAGIYKPHPKVYQRSRSTGSWLPGAAIAFPIARILDAYAASAFRCMKVVWCNRYAQRRERAAPAPLDREIRSLAELPALVGAA